MIFKQKKLWTEPDDQCSTCANLRKCPLADALTQRVVLLATESLGVHACGLYVEQAAPKMRLLP